MTDVRVTLNHPEDDTVVRLAHPTGGAVVIELPMGAALAGATLKALADLGFELERVGKAGG